MIAALVIIAFPVLCWLAYRFGYGWNTVNVNDPFTVTTFGQRNPDALDHSDIDLRPGGVTTYSGEFTALYQRELNRVIVEFPGANLHGRKR